MSITPSTKTPRPRTSRFALVSAVTLGLLGGPVALAAPADASASLRGCTVEALKPSLRDHQIDFRIKVDCNGNKTVQIKQLRFEDERGRRHDDLTGVSWFWRSLDRHDDSVTIHNYVDRHGSQRVYQLVSFRVRSGNSDNWSDWSSWDKSEVLSVWQWR